MNRMRTSRGLFALLLVLLAGGHAVSQGKAKKKARRVEAKLVKLGEKLGVSVEALRAVGGERFLSRRAQVRRALLAKIAATRSGDLAPLVVHMAKYDKDLDCRYSATALISAVGLEADRAVYTQVIVPALAELFQDKHEKVRFEAADEANRLARWFKLDLEIAPLLEETFEGRRHRMAVRAWKGLLALENPELREGLVLRAMKEVQDRRSRFSVNERRASFRENGRRAGPWGVHELAALVVEDGTVAVACAQALADLGDPAALPCLRRINRSSAHVLRVPVLMTRGVLQDETLLDELPETLESDHLTIQVALVAAIARLKDPKVDKVLPRVAKIAREKVLKRAVALARLRRGDVGGEAILREALSGEAPDPIAARLVLDIEDAAAEALVVRIAHLTAKPVAAQRRRAVARIGADGIDTKETRALLRELQRGGKDALRLFAAASLLQLGAEDGEEALEEALKGYDVVNRTNVTTRVGPGKRFNGSPLIAVLERLGRRPTLEALPLLARWLDPPEPKAKQREPKEKQTRERRPIARPTPAKVPAWLSQQFVRRSAVEALGAIALALTGRIAAPREGDEVGELQARLALAVKALVRSLADARGVVRRGALRALAPLADAELPVGASLEEEDEVAVEVESWLKQRGSG